MIFETLGRRDAPAVLFFHAMGVTGASSEPVAKHLQDTYFCILPTSTVYCAGQKYISRADEVRQVENFLRAQGVKRLALVVASSIGADLAMAFLTHTDLPVEHVYFDGGQFAQIAPGTRRIMVPFLYLAIRSIFRSNGATLKKVLWCDDDAIKPYFIAAGKALTYGNLRRQLADGFGGGVDLVFRVKAGEAEPHRALPDGAEGFVHPRGAVGAGAGGDAVVGEQHVRDLGRIVVPDVEGHDGRALRLRKIAVDGDAGDIPHRVVKPPHERAFPRTDGRHALGQKIVQRGVQPGDAVAVERARLQPGGVRLRLILVIGVYARAAAQQGTDVHTRADAQPARALRAHEPLVPREAEHVDALGLHVVRLRPGVLCLLVF